MLLVAFQVQAESLVEGSIEAGKAKSTTCMACHGPAGISPLATWPNIAGQSATYIATQLTAFRDGVSDPENATRYEATMSPMSMLLTDEDIRNLAVYYESLPAAAMAVADPGKVDKGQALYRGGDSASGTAACLACHGPARQGAAIRPQIIRHFRASIRSTLPSNCETMPAAAAPPMARPESCVTSLRV